VIFVVFNDRADLGRALATDASFLWNRRATQIHKYFHMELNIRVMLVFYTAFELIDEFECDNLRAEMWSF
jgi:hypothetical protein